MSNPRNGSPKISRFNFLATLCLAVIGTGSLLNLSQTTSVMAAAPATPARGPAAAPGGGGRGGRGGGGGGAAPAGQPPTAATAIPDAPKKLTIIDNIAYRAGPSPAWRLDLAMPQAPGNQRLPAIMIVHGGGWTAGEKTDRVYRTMLLYYAEKGYVTASVEYRLTGEAPFPAAIEDVKCALRFLRAHADEYHIDPDHIGAFGHSAGAHLVMMLAMCPPSAGLEGDGGAFEFSSKPTSVVAASTPSRYTRPDAKPAWSPMNYVNEPHLPPMLLIHGLADTTVPIAGTDELVDALKKAGNQDLTYIRVENANHGVAYEHYLDLSFRAMDAFFERTLKPGTAGAKATQ